MCKLVYSYHDARIRITDKIRPFITCIEVIPPNPIKSSATKNPLGTLNAFASYKSIDLLCNEFFKALQKKYSRIMVYYSTCHGKYTAGWRFPENTSVALCHSWNTSLKRNYSRSTPRPYASANLTRSLHPVAKYMIHAVEGRSDIFHSAADSTGWSDRGVSNLSPKILGNVRFLTMDPAALTEHNTPKEIVGNSGEGLLSFLAANRTASLLAPRVTDLTQVPTLIADKRNGLFSPCSQARGRKQQMLRSQLSDIFTSAMETKTSSNPFALSVEAKETYSNHSALSNGLPTAAAASQLSSFPMIIFEL
ncbi:hypothetical protein BDD12DRAFT_802074 [Trichophaea hybrida]|nr:hypothetical protein BDD12DRAFT_802074 [Trichophaea hybrida]